MVPKFSLSDMKIDGTLYLYDSSIKNNSFTHVIEKKIEMWKERFKIW